MATIPVTTIGDLPSDTTTIGAIAVIASVALVGASWWLVWERELCIPIGMRMTIALFDNRNSWEFSCIIARSAKSYLVDDIVILLAQEGICQRHTFSPQTFSDNTLTSGCYFERIIN